MNQGINTDKIARIWETKDGFIIADWDNALITNKVFATDAEAGEYVKNEGFEEIIWMEVE